MKKGEHDIPTPWPGLTFVLARGLPGYPAPRIAEPPVGYQHVTVSQRPNEWGDAL